MKRSLARSFFLSTLVVAFAATTASGAGNLSDFTVRAFNGNYAYGMNWKTQHPARINLKTGAMRDYAIPTVATTVDIFAASSTTMVGTATNTSNSNFARWLYRYDVRTGQQQLLATSPTNRPPASGIAQFCNSDFRPLAVADDGAAVALSLVSTFSGWDCVQDPKYGSLLRYPPKSDSPETMWMPERYRERLAVSSIAVNEDTIAIASPTTTPNVTDLAVIDSRSKSVLAERSAGTIGGLWLANPHSLYVSENPASSDGRLSYWRMGHKERTLRRGRSVATNTRNCGNRVVVTSGNTLSLIDRRGKVVLKRHIKKSKYHEFSGIVCSADHLQYLDVDREGYSPGMGEYDYTRKILNISRLP